MVALLFSPRCRVLVAVDGFNAIFGERTHLKRDDRSYVLPSQITLSRALLDATSNDWVRKLTS